MCKVAPQKSFLYILQAVVSIVTIKLPILYVIINLVPDLGDLYLFLKTCHFGN